jgi:hypothetical protein
MLEELSQSFLTRSYVRMISQMFPWIQNLLILHLEGNKDHHYLVWLS